MKSGKLIDFNPITWWWTVLPMINGDEYEYSTAISTTNKTTNIRINRGIKKWLKTMAVGKYIIFDSRNIWFENKEDLNIFIMTWK